MRIQLLLFFLLTSTLLFGQKGTIKFHSIGLKDGLSQSSINDIIQDNKGFVWFGTQDGLNRYDGYKFTVFKHNPKDSTSLSDNFVNSLLIDQSENIWIGTEGGLNKYDAQLEKFSHFQVSPNSQTSLSGNNIKDLCEDRYGNIWIAVADGGLNRYNRSSNDFKIYKNSEKTPNLIADNNLLSVYTDKEGIIWIGSEGEGMNYILPGEEKIYFANNPGLLYELPYHISNIYEDTQNRLWIAAANGIYLYNKEKKTFEIPSLFKQNISLWSSIKKVTKIIEDKSDHIWIATGNGLYKCDPHSGNIIYFESNSKLDYSLNSNLIHSLYEDNTGTFWIGSNNGINRFDRTKQNFSHLHHIPGAESTLNSNIVWSIAEGQNEILWIGTDLGLNKIDRKTNEIKNYYHGIKKKTSQKGEVVYSIFEAHDKTLWIGTNVGLFVFDPKSETFSRFSNTNTTSLEHLNNNRIYTIIEDNAYNLWIGTKNGLFIIDSSRKKLFEYFNDPQNPFSLSNNVVRNIKRDKKGNIWIATNSSGLNKIESSKLVQYDSLHFTTYSDHDLNLKGVNYNCLYIDENNFIWIGSYGGGLYRFDTKTKKFKQYTEQDGLSNNVIYGILGDNQNNLWMSTNKGISKFNIPTERFHNYYEGDGLQSDEFNTGAYFCSSNGEFFFGGLNGFNSFFPDRIEINKIPPKVVITDFQIFNKTVRIGDKNSPLKQSIIQTEELTLTHKQGVITFEFAALHFSSPDKNKYAYMMEGFDEDWNSVSNRRQATYTNLDPGEYTFKVKAANSDDIWNEDWASIKLTILPPIWKTWWFRTLLIALLIGILMGIYFARINVIKAQKIFLERQVKERTSEILDKTKKIESQNKLLEKEKEKVEKLLLNMLPQETVDELKTKGKASARHYRTASVMFTDFKGFTKFAEKIRPKDLVEELDNCFIKFDGIIEKYNLEKIKTIGDSYMCAGGLPVRNKSNPIDIVLAALEIQRYMKTLREEKKAEGKDSWELRIGINTGELIAGVVGIKRLAYDIWGDTVNVASRMEMQGDPGKVNISGTTYKLIKEYFECTYRGKILAKNKGEIDMYFVDQIKPELSENKEGLIPNILFNEKIHSNLYSKINYQKAENFILSRLEKELSSELSYHTLSHTIDVRNAAENIALAEGIRGDELILVKTAAILHDIGFLVKYEKNEEEAVKIAKDILPNYGYTDEQIELINGMILATQIPHQPQNIFEEILCDADLDYLGREDFSSIAENLKKELFGVNRIKTELDWDAMQIKFFEQHIYFTGYSILNRKENKEKRLVEIKERYKAYQS